MKDRTIIIAIFGIIIILSIYGFSAYTGKDLLDINIASPKLSTSSNLLFIGSSSVNDPYSFADQLQDLYPDLSITKVAQDGAKTDWMLSQATGEIQSGNYDGIFILGGLNDIYATGSVETAKQNLQSLYDLCKSNSAVLIAITLQPTDNYYAYTESKGDLTIQLNDWIEDNGTPDIIIDNYSMLTDSNGNQNIDLFKTDYLHLSSDAQLLLAQEIAGEIF